MKVISSTNKDIGINSINKLREVCYETKNINILGNSDIDWIKHHKNEVLELHKEFLSTKGAIEALCNLEVIGEVYFEDLDLI